MKRVCFTLQLKQNLIEDYLRAHRVWPEMEQSMRDAGFRNYSMFIRNDGLLVGYFEAENPELSLRQHGQTEINQRWQKNVAKYFESDVDIEGPKLHWLNQYYYLE